MESRWVSSDNLISSTIGIRTDRHGINEVLLKVSLIPYNPVMLIPCRGEEDFYVE